MRTVAFILILFTLGQVSVGQNRSPIETAGVPACRLDDRLPSRVIVAAEAAWEIASKDFKGVPPGVVSNPRGPTAQLALFFVKDALEGSAPCRPKAPGLGDGSLRQFDSQTVAGICYTHDGVIVCSSEAVRAILEGEDRKDVSPSLAYLFAHEFGHILLHHPGAFTEGVTRVSFSRVRDDNIAQFGASCESDPDQFKHEQEADKFAFEVVKKLFTRPPYRGATMDERNAIVDNSEFIYWTGKTIGNWASRYYGAPTTDPFPNVKQLCTLVSRTSGTVVLPVYGGTHPQPWNRLASIVNFEGEYVNSVRLASGESLGRGDESFLSMNRLTDNLLAKTFDAAAARFCQRVSELENRTIDCAHLPETTPNTESYDLPSEPSERTVNLPINFVPSGPYREAAEDDPSVFTFSLGSYNRAPSKELALQEAQRMAAAYTLFFAQVDDYLHSHGGYWIYEWHSPVATSFSNFAGEYMTSMKARAIIRVPHGFDPTALPAFSALKRWGRVDDAHVVPWSQSAHEVVIHFFRPGTKGSNKDSQRVITRPLRFDEIFDLPAAREGKVSSPGIFFRDLLPFLHSRLKAKFGFSYTLDEGGQSDDAFYITAAKLGDSFYLPKSWESLIDSATARVTADSELARAVAHILIDNSTEEDQASIFNARPH